MTIDRTEISPPGSRSYDTERADRLPFGTPEKADRYRTDRFLGATGLNWYTCDPTLQFLTRYQLTGDELAWATPRLERLGELMGGAIAARADLTDKNPPRLIKYDRWGHDISEVLLPESAVATKRDLIEHGFGTPAFRTEAERAGVRLETLTGAYTYLLCQAEIGMTCAMGADAGMVRAMVDLFAPEEVKDHVLPKLDSGEWVGKTGQFFTERTGGSDLGELETTATPNGDSWVLNGLKWFSSNCDGEIFVVLAKPVGAHDGVRGVVPFLVMKHRLDGSRNGMRIRQLKDKLGTKAVPSGEVELADAEAFMMAPSSDGGSTGDGHGLARLMTLTNLARVGIASMGLGCARRALVESLCYASARSAWKRRLIDQPLMRRKLAEMIVDVEAAQALVFDQYQPANHQRPGGVGSAHERLRIGGDLAKLRCARLGITTASDAIEVHGGNGYVETWPVARVLRDAQINTLWEGPDNILCLDVRRGIEREGADGPLLARIEEALSGAAADEATDLVARRAEDLRLAIESWRALDRETGEARLYPLARFMVDVYSGALLVEQAAWERTALGGDRKALVARLFARRRLGESGPLRGIDERNEEALDRFEELAGGALVDDRGR
ncbi:MAG: acyl-CoA dehydrogenase family protein [Actinomycetota bacterium]